MLDSPTGDIGTQQITGRPRESVLEGLATVAQPFRAAYEAGTNRLSALRRPHDQGLSGPLTGAVDMDPESWTRLAIFQSTKIGETNAQVVRAGVRRGCGLTGSFFTATPTLNDVIRCHSALLSVFGPSFLSRVQRSVNHKVQGSNPCPGANFVYKFG